MDLNQNNKEIELSKDYKNYVKKQINIIKEMVEQIIKSLIKLKEETGNFLSRNIVSSLELKENLYLYLDNLNNEKEKINFIKEKQNFLIKIKNIFLKYKKYSLNIIENAYIKKICELNGNIYLLLHDISDYKFCPPNINSINNQNINPSNNSNNKSIEINSISIGHSITSYLDKITEIDKYENFYNNIDNIKLEENKKEINYICSICKNNDSNYFCFHCNVLLCNECVDKFTFQSKFHKIIIIKKNNSERDKQLFLNSLAFTIKTILIKANYLIKHEKIYSKQLDGNNNSYCIIKRGFKYPFIIDMKDSNSLLNFLIDINSILFKEMSFRDINIYSFHISDMERSIIQVISSIVKDDKIDLFKEELNLIDNIDFDDEDFKDSIIYGKRL